MSTPSETLQQSDDNLNRSITNNNDTGADGVSLTELTSIEDFIDDETSEAIHTLVKYNGLMHFISKLAEWFPNNRGLRDMYASAKSYKYSDRKALQSMCEWLIPCVIQKECRLAYKSGKLFFDLRTELKGIDDGDAIYTITKNVAEYQSGIRNITLSPQYCSEYLTLKRISNEFLAVLNVFIKNNLNYDQLYTALRSKSASCTNRPKCHVKFRNSLSGPSSSSTGTGTLSMDQVKDLKPCNTCLVNIQQTMDFSKITALYHNVKQHLLDERLDRNLMVRIFMLVLLERCKLDEHVPPVAAFIRTAYDQADVIAYIDGDKEKLSLLRSVLQLAQSSGGCGLDIQSMMQMAQFSFDSA